MAPFSDKTWFHTDPAEQKYVQMYFLPLPIQINLYVHKSYLFTWVSCCVQQIMNLFIVQLKIE